MNRDHEDLKTLSIFYYVFAGLTAFLSFIPLIYLAIGVMMLLLMGAAASEVGQVESPAGPPPPGMFALAFAIPGLFILFSLIGFVAVLIGAWLQYLTGRKLGQHRGYTFCMVSAAFHLTSFPLGTILGIFTLIVLCRESTKALFGRPYSPGYAGPGHQPIPGGGPIAPAAPLKHATPVERRPVWRVYAIAGAIAGSIALVLFGLFAGYVWFSYSMSRNMAEARRAREVERSRQLQSSPTESASAPVDEVIPRVYFDPIPATPSGPQNLDEALAALDGSDAFARREAAEWLANASRDETRQPEIARALDRLIQDDDAVACDVALRAAAVWGDQESTPALLAALDRPFRAKFAAEALGKQKDQRAIEPLVKLLDEPFAAGDAAATALIEFDRDLTRPSLLPRFHDANERARERARGIIARQGEGDDLLDQTGKDLETGDAYRRRAAMEWLTRCEVKDSHRTAITAAICNTIEPDAQMFNDPTAVALGRWAGKEQAPLLMELVNDDAEGRKMAGLRAMLAIDAAAVREPLAKMAADRSRFGDVLFLLRDAGPGAEVAAVTLLENDNPDVQAEACMLLMQIGSEKAREPLEKTRQAAEARGDLKVKVLAQGALSGIELRTRVGEQAVRRYLCFFSSSFVPG